MRKMRSVLAFRPWSFAKHRIGRMFAAMGVAVEKAVGTLKSYRVRMIVEVDTPQGVHSGSGVLEIRANRIPTLGFPEARSLHVALIGEAVPIDLPRGQMLFALLRTADNRHEMEGRITGALDPEYRGGAKQFWASLRRLSDRAMIGRSAALPPESYPLLVRFRDPAVPASVEAAEAGIQIRAVHLVITNEKVTRGIERRLAWLGELRSYLSGRGANFGGDLANSLGSHDFIKGR